MNLVYDPAVQMFLFTTRVYVPFVIQIILFCPKATVYEQLSFILNVTPKIGQPYSKSIHYSYKLNGKKGHFI